jgi:ketosteroid isomerase-like protein
MDDATRKDLDAIEDIHRRDVAATKAGDLEALKSLMDAQCVVFPPDSEPEAGQSYLDHARASSDGAEPQTEILELVQEWEEVQLLGDFAYEQGVVRYAVRDANGTVIRETQRLMRLLRRQPDGGWRVLRAMWHAPRRASEETTGGIG